MEDQDGATLQLYPHELSIKRSGAAGAAARAADSIPRSRPLPKRPAAGLHEHVLM